MILQESGKIIEIGFPKGRAPKLPYKRPEAKRVVLLDIVLETSLREFWNDIMSSSSDVFATFHKNMGEKDIYLGSWREQADGSKTRLLKFTTPLKNPLGPKQAFNYETFKLVDISPNGFVVEVKCITAGVPFSSNFENDLQWVASQEDNGHTRLVITGECNFTSPIFGPLKSTISRESINGMARAYKIFKGMVTNKYGEHVEEESLVPSYDTLDALTKSSYMAGITNAAQTNPAVLVVILSTFIIIWRIMMTNTLYHALLRKVAQQVMS